LFVVSTCTYIIIYHISCEQLYLFVTSRYKTEKIKTVFAH